MLEIIKWILVVLVSGFIAYIGRFGAQWLIERQRAKRQPPKENNRPDHIDPETWAKTEKKRLKALGKAEKKHKRD